jgi:transglutaminase-like putative cysteine protease
MKFIALLFILFPVLIWGQFSEEYTAVKAKYPDKDMVYLKRHLTIQIAMDNDELKVSSNVSDESLLLSNRAQFFTEDEISYSTFFDVDNINASSLNFSKGKYRETKVKDFSHKDDLSGFAFHDDSRIINFRYSNLEEGSKTRLSYDETIKNPRFLPGFFFGGYFPSLDSKFTLVVDKSIELKFYKFNLEGYDIKETKEEKGNNIIYTWSCENEPTYEIETNAVSGRFFLPQVIPVILKYPTADGEKALLGSPKDLYAWYQELVSEVNQSEPDPEMVTLVNELVAGKESDLEKVRSIYYWAQKNIKYVAYEYGLGGFIPREANDIFQKKFGDCKDNSSIMKEMLDIAGIKSYLTWIGTRDIPYSYSEFPTPSVDNHMILTYIDGEDHYFLDATGRFLSLEMPSSFIQGKEALIGLDAENFKIYKVPEIAADDNAYVDTTELRIEGNTLFGNAHGIAKGYLKQDYFSAMESNETGDRKDWFYRQNFRKGNNRFELSNLREVNKYNYDEDMEIMFDFEIKHYVIQNEDELYVNLNLSKQMAGQKIEEEDLIDKEMDFTRCGKYYITLTVPEGYNVSYLPADFEVEEDLWEGSITYKKEDNKIIYSYEVRLEFIRLESEYFKAYNKFIEDLEREFKESVVLSK